MSDADFRLIPPIPISDAGPFTRASSATYWDRTGTLQTAGPDEFRVTYDPSDLSAPPYALIEPNAINYIRNNTVQGVIAGSPGVMPNYWASDASGTNGLTREVLLGGVEDGIEYFDLRFYGTATTGGTHNINFEQATAIGTTVGEVWGASVFVTLIAGDVRTVGNTRLQISERDNAGAQLFAASANFDLEVKPLRKGRLELAHTIQNVGATKVNHKIVFSYSLGALVDITMRIGLPQIERNRVTSPIKTVNGANSRAADVISTTPGLIYSNVPETEPLWVAGTYAKGARVRDAAHVVWESLVDGNTAALDDGTKWGRVGATNRYKMFDKAVNSQTVAPDAVTFTLTTTGVANTLMLLNLAGNRVTIAQADSGYSKSKSLVRHEVSNWYDFFYQEPIRSGDAVFEGIPPYPGSPITVTVHNPGSVAGIGCAILSKAIVLGTTQWELVADMLSYSTSTTDSDGNITMKKRPGARRMSAEVAIRKGFETEAYRLLMTYTDVEIGVIAATQYEMTYGYGFLGQWNVPLSITGRKAAIEFRSLT